MKILTVNKHIGQLHEVSEAVDMNNKSLIEFLKDSLISTYEEYNKNMQGLAAPQIGQLYRVILVRYRKGDEPAVLFNPSILLRFGKCQSNEGCLSEGDFRYLVERPALCLITYFSDKGKKVIKWLPYKKARIFEHELDHLDGILLRDKGIKK